MDGWLDGWKIGVDCSEFQHIKAISLQPVQFGEINLLEERP